MTKGDDDEAVRTISLISFSWVMPTKLELIFVECRLRIHNMMIDVKEVIKSEAQKYFVLSIWYAFPEQSLQT